jgi:hypothetical protein
MYLTFNQNTLCICSFLLDSPHLECSKHNVFNEFLSSKSVILVIFLTLYIKLVNEDTIFFKSL